MNFFERLSAGWKLSGQCFSVLKQNKQLLIFPLLSSISLVVVALSFLLAIMLPADWDAERVIDEAGPLHYALLFVFYLVNYFIIIFFNMALVHCARISFQGDKPTVGQGLAFSMSRIGVITGWAMIAATVGLVLKAIEENSGKLGELLSGLLGVVWSVMTFFVVPVIAYENIGPFAAIKRSTALMKQKWGESVGASFSFFLVQVVGFILFVVPVFMIGYGFNPVLGIVLGAVALFILGAVISAAQTIFVSAVYHKLNNQPVEGFEDDKTIDQLFTKKESGW